VQNLTTALDKKEAELVSFGNDRKQEEACLTEALASAKQVNKVPHFLTNQVIFYALQMCAPSTTQPFTYWCQTPKILARTLERDFPGCDAFLKAKVILRRCLT
jgi:hypothetical protein